MEIVQKVEKSGIASLQLRKKYRQESSMHKKSRIKLCRMVEVKKTS